MRLRPLGQLSVAGCLAGSRGGLKRKGGGEAGKSEQYQADAAVLFAFLLDLADPVPEAPELAASRRDLDIEAALVSDLVRLVFGLEGAKPSLGQRHVRAFSQCGFRKGPQKARKNVRNPREKAGRSGTIQGPIPLDFCGFNTLFEMFREEQMVPRRGLEPPRPCERQHLKLVRLPIPPSGHGMFGPNSSKHFG